MMNTSYSYSKIFSAFFKAGMLGFGGGLSAIPLMHREVVTNYKWLDEDEFADMLALANTLPGPINTKLSGYIGWQLRGFWGMMVGIAATIFPTAILMILLFTVLNAYKDMSWVQGMSQAAIPIAGVMIGVMTWGFVVNSKKSLGWLKTILFIAIGVIVMQVLNIHPAILIVLIIAAALILPGEKKAERGQEVRK